MAVVLINLDQFENPETNIWVEGLISLSSDFFKRKKVHKKYLFLEESESLPLKDSLTMLNEASSVDFTYRTTVNSACTTELTIEDLCAELDEYYDNAIVEPEYNYEG